MTETLEDARDRNFLAVYLEQLYRSEREYVHAFERAIEKNPSLEKLLTICLADAKGNGLLPQDHKLLEEMQQHVRRVQWDTPEQRQRLKTLEQQLVVRGQALQTLKAECANLQERIRTLESALQALRHPPDTPPNPPRID